MEVIRKDSVSQDRTDAGPESFYKVDWFGLDAAIARGKTFSQGTAHDFLFWPFSMPSFNPLNPIFLWQVPGLGLLQQKSQWLVRDGKKGLLDFFKKFPRPEVFKGRLLLLTKFQTLVPRAWKKHVQFYDWVSCLAPREYEYLFFMGLAAGLKTFQNPEVRFPGKSFLLSAAGVPVGVPGMLALDWHQILYHTDFSKALCIEVGLQDWLSDNYLMHWVLSRGGQCESALSVSRDQIDILLSPHHGIRFFKEK